MYELGILALGGLICAKTSDLVGHFAKRMTAAVALVVTMAIGVGYAFLFDFSVFANWGVPVRSDVLGTLGTGLFMGALAYVWHATLHLVSESAARYHGEAAEHEARLQKAA